MGFYYFWRIPWQFKTHDTGKMFFWFFCLTSSTVRETESATEFYFSCFWISSHRKRWRAKTSWFRVSWASPKSRWCEWTSGPKTWSRSGPSPQSRGGRRPPRASPWWEDSPMRPFGLIYFSSLGSLQARSLALFPASWASRGGSEWRRLSPAATEHSLCRGGGRRPFIPSRTSLTEQLSFVFPLSVSALCPHPRVNKQRGFNLADLVEALVLLNYRSLAPLVQSAVCSEHLEVWLVGHVPKQPCIRMRLESAVSPGSATLLAGGGRNASGVCVHPRFPPQTVRQVHLTDLHVALQTSWLCKFTLIVTVTFSALFTVLYQVYCCWETTCLPSVCRTLGSTRRATTRFRPPKGSRFLSLLLATSTSFWKRWDFFTFQPHRGFITKRCPCPCARGYKLSFVFCAIWPGKNVPGAKDFKKSTLLFLFLHFMCRVCALACR